MGRFSCQEKTASDKKCQTSGAGLREPASQITTVRYGLKGSQRAFTVDAPALNLGQ
jgi:hypothetical protein